MKDGLAGNWVSSICDDQHGGLWLSSPQGGLTHYVNGKFIVYTSHIGLFTDQIFCVLLDHHGDLWLSSPQGIGTIQHQTIEAYESGKDSSITMRVFLVADGMKTDECFGEWCPAGWKTHDGCIWFATKHGAAMIDPDKLKTNTIPPPVFINKVIANQHEISLGSDIALPAGTKRVEFHYTALSYLNPDRVRFKVLLEGYDHEWTEEGTQRIAIYTNLSPGSYRFRVMACNNDGVWNEAGMSVAFVLEPYFYQTMWFYALLVVSIIGAGFGIYRLRVWQLLKREKELKVRIDEAIANIKVLGGLIPICANCKKIRDDKGYWDQLEGYIQSHSEAHFTHGICPDCAKKLYPELTVEKKVS